MAVREAGKRSAEGLAEIGKALWLEDDVVQPQVVLLAMHPEVIEASLM